MADLKSIEIERIGSTERIAALDVLRGVAILCILFMNIPDMGSFTFIVGDPRLPTWTGFDRIAWWVQTAAFSGTQRGLLELLFGAGILIMARRAMEPDGPVAVADLHFRRNLLLCALGLFNAFVLMWYGDILLTYGLAALVLFPFRMLKPRALIAWALAIFAAMFLLFQMPNYRSQVEQKVTYERVEAATAAHRKVSADDKKAADEYRERLTAFRTLPMQQPKTIEKVKKVEKAYASGLPGYWEVQAEQWRKIMSFFWVIEGEIVATMLIGMALFRLGIIQGTAPTRTYWSLLVAGYGFGLAVRGHAAWLLVNDVPDPLWQESLYDFTRLAVTLGHLAAIHLALRSALGRAALRPFEAAGKLPLTIYLGTSLLMMWFVFAPWGLGLFGTLGFGLQMATAAGVILVELIAANVWMRYYETGPFEWLWKSLAYQRRMPFRRHPKEPTMPPDLVPAG